MYSANIEVADNILVGNQKVRIHDGNNNAISIHDNTATGLLTALVGPDALSTLTGTSGAEAVDGTTGGDTILGLGGADKLYGEAGSDIIDGGDGSDYLYGGLGGGRTDRRRRQRRVRLQHGAEWRDRSRHRFRAWL